MVTSKQIADYFWKYKKDVKNPLYLADRRLKVLYDLNCVDRFFPAAPIGEGSNPQHLTLDRAGAKVLGLDTFYKMRKLPRSYKHYIAVGDIRIEFKKLGFSWGKKEHKIGPVKADIFYPNHRLTIEVDRGTESYDTLKEKVRRYNRLTNKNITVIFITQGSEDRCLKFTENLVIPNAYSTFENLDKLLPKVRSKFL